MSDDPLSTPDRDRIARKMCGDEVLDAEGNFCARSSDEEVAILRECVPELQGRATSGHGQS